jgi:hypothetical protein
MPAHAALLRFPHGRVLLARTKLAYVHLHNLLGDAKRDRTARVAGYVAIWLPDEFMVLFLRDGEVRTAISVMASGSAERVSIASALARVPADPEFGEICFHEASPGLLACMHHALLVPDMPWPGELAAGDPRALFPHLRDTRFDGVIEVINRDTANYLVIRDGLIDQTHVVDEAVGGRTEQLARLFGPPSPRPRVRVRGWQGPVSLPSQAPPALVGAYRDLIEKLYAELAATGVPVPSAVGERVRDALLERHPALCAFARGPKVQDPADEQAVVTTAIAAWMTEVVREAVDGDDALARRVLTAATRERRHMLHAAGFLAALPWELEW